MTAAVIALSAAVVVLAVLVAGLLRSHGEILRALHELGAGLELDRAGSGQSSAVPVTIEGISAPRREGGPVPDVPETLVGAALDGDEAVALSLRGHDVLLAFLSSGCATCAAFWQAFARGVDDVPGGARLVVVTRDLDEESESALAELAGGVPVVASTLAWTQFAVPGSPYFVYVSGAEGRVVGEGSGASWPQVADLLRQARADDAQRTRRAAGTGSGPVRELRDDVALAEAGITRGHASLWRSPEPDAP